MKKLYLLLIISLHAIQGNAQTYYPMLDSVSNSWTFIWNVMPVRVQQVSTPCNYNSFNTSSTAFYTTNDTVIGTETYKILNSVEFGNSSSLCDFGYIREDTATERIYFMDNTFSPEILLYDFSMQVGDSINLDFISQWGAYYVNGNYYLDSIETITINAGVRRIFYLSNPLNPWQYPLEWIESVGHPGHLVYTHSLNYLGGTMFWCNDPIVRDFYQLLTCFEHNSQKVYFDSCAHANAVINWCYFYADSCNFWNICSALPESSMITEFTISPNPATDNLFISISSEKMISAEIRLYDFIGKNVMQTPAKLIAGTNQFSFDTQGLDQGIYLMTLSSNSGFLSRKIVVEK